MLPLAGIKPACFLLQAVPRLAVVFLGFGQPSRGGTASMSRAARATWAGRLRRAWSWLAYENYGMVRGDHSASSQAVPSSTHPPPLSLPSFPLLSLPPFLLCIPAGVAAHLVCAVHAAPLLLPGVPALPLLLSRWRDVQLCDSTCRASSFLAQLVLTYFEG